MTAFIRYKAIKLAEAWRFSALMAVVFCAAAIIQYFTLPYSDLTNLLWQSRQMLGGLTLYTDILEINPPLILWLYAPCVALGEITGLAPIYILKIATFVLIALVLWLSAIILRQSAVPDRNQRHSLLLLIAGLLLLLPNQYLTFAQREHLLPILIMPYVLLQLPSVSRDAVNSTLKIGIGLLAGIGFCIKPPFFIIWVGILAHRFFIKATSRAFFSLPDALIITTAGAYIAAMCLFAPHYFEWLHIIQQVYVGFGGSLILKLIKYGLAGMVALLIAYGIGAFSLPKMAHYRADTIYLFWVAASALAEGLLQFKTWIYIYYPFLVFGGLALGMVIIFKPVKHFLAFALMAVLFFPSTPLNDNFEQEQTRYEENVLRAIAPYRSAKDFYYVGLYVAPAQMEMYIDGMQRANKLAHLNVFIENIMQVSPITNQPVLIIRPGREALQDWLFSSMSDEIEKKRPQLLLVSHLWDTKKPEDSFDFMEWFKRSPRLNQDLGHYQLREEFEACADPQRPAASFRCSFMLFTRKETP